MQGPNNVAHRPNFNMAKGAGSNTLNFLTGQNYFSPSNKPMRSYGSHNKSPMRSLTKPPILPKQLSHSYGGTVITLNQYGKVSVTTEPSKT